VDNAPTHSGLEVDGVSVVFLPKNTTSLIQPLDHGLIRWAKYLYWQFAEERCFLETEGAPDKQLNWFSQMKPRVAFEILQKVTEHLNGPEGKTVAIRCWNSALGVDEGIAQEEYSKKLNKRLPGPNSLEELLLSPAAAEPLKLLENMCATWMAKLKNQAPTMDVEQESEAESEKDIELQRLAEFEKFLSEHGNCPQVQRMLHEALNAEH